MRAIAQRVAHMPAILGFHGRPATGGSEDFKGYGVLDLAATYSIPVCRTARPWIKFELYNALNNKLIVWDTMITPDRASALDANGLPTGYIKGGRFGQVTADNQFP